MLSCRSCYHVEQNVILWDKILSCGANFLSCGSLQVIMWDKMLSCGDNDVEKMFMQKLMLSCGT